MLSIDHSDRPILNAFPPPNQGSAPTAGTESRLRALIDEHLDLDREPSPDGSFADSGISSLDAVAFIRIVEREFNVSIPPEDCHKIATFGKLIAHLDAKTG